MRHQSPPRRAKSNPPFHLCIPTLETHSGLNDESGGNVYAAEESAANNLTRPGVLLMLEAIGLHLGFAKSTP